LQRPYIILKWAQTADGFVDDMGEKPFPISDTLNRQWVHKWRAREQAILVGSGTAIKDRPSLTVRHWAPALPIRIFFDRQLKIPSQILNSVSKTLVYNNLKSCINKNVEFVYPAQQDFLASSFKDIWSRGIQSVLVEGGPKLVQLLMEQGLWDEIRVSISENKLGSGIKAPIVDKLAQLEFETGNRINTFVHLNKENINLRELKPTQWAL
jgi:diaminohydroxyphosphoribosylaminopyrimidine deaminase/5-amino-6-(5-phosphoribosylamino)uracil reductase